MPFKQAQLCSRVLSRTAVVTWVGKADFPKALQPIYTDHPLEHAAQASATLACAACSPVILSERVVSPENNRCFFCPAHFSDKTRCDGSRAVTATCDRIRPWTTFYTFAWPFTCNFS